MKILILALVSLLALSLSSVAPDEDVAEVKRVLTDFHAAAAEPDVERYLGYMAPDGVFFGTDARERWPYEAYVARVRPALEQGIQIVNRPVEQNVFVSEDGKTAWFDEKLDKPKYGEMRATGVLRKTEDGWKIVQFHLTFPIPNEIVPDVVKLTRAAVKNR